MLTFTIIDYVSSALTHYKICKILTSEIAMKNIFFHKFTLEFFSELSWDPHSKTNYPYFFSYPGILFGIPLELP